MQDKRTFLTVEVTEEQRVALKKAAHRAEANMSELVRRSVATTLRDIAPELVTCWAGEER
jgi:hypothetical protein